MGGVMINGCGAADSFYLLKSLPGHTCRSCRKTDYALMEVKRKVRVFYIPTIALNTKYAISCPKCKTGYYISEEQKNYVLLHDPSCVEMTGDGVIIRMEPQVQQLEQAQEEMILLEEESTAPAGGAVCSCGAPLEPHAVFCMNCGAKVGESAAEQPVSEVVQPAAEQPVSKVVQPEEPAPAPEVREIPLPKPEPASLTAAPVQMPAYKRGIVCPGCGMRSMAGKTHCSICGTKLE